MLREELNEKDTWDLTTIFANNEEFEKAFNNANIEIENIKKYENIMINSSDELYQTTKTIYEVGEKIDRIYTYANLKYSEDTSNNDSQTLIGRAQELYKKFSEATVFYDTKLISLDEETFEKYISENKNLREYEIVLRNAYKYKPHTLSDAEEKLLAAFQKERGTASDIYETFTASDLTFGKIKDENGKEVELTDTNYSLYMKSQNPEVRRSAFKTLYKTYEQYQNTFASIYAGQIEVEKTCAKVHGYKSAMEAALFADDVTPEVYDNIVNSISNHLDVLFKYYRMKKRVLGLNDMHIYDIYVPLISNFERNYTYDEAVNEVLEATHIFGDEYVNILKQGYKDRWVDVYPNKGKRGGAFSGGCAQQIHLYY